MELVLDPLKEVAGALLAAMLVLGAAVVLRYVNEYLKLEVVSKQQQALEAIALEVVHVVAQTSGASVSGPAKKGQGSESARRQGDRGRHQDRRGEGRGPH